MIYALIGCVLIIGFLGFKLSLKQKIDKEILDQYNLDIDTARTDLHELVMQLRTEIQRVAQYKTEYKQYKLRAEEYQDLINNKFADIDSQIEELRQKRQEELDKHLQETKEKYQFILDAVERDCLNKAEKLQLELDDKYTDVSTRMNLMEKATQAAENMYLSLLEPLKMYEKERQDKLFYTIQLPEEYRDDIEFLLTTVAAKVQHPDIISKLVWSEYVKPNLDDTFKRIEIKAEPGIYKITNLDSGKAYIGKSTDVKKRLTDHFKSSVGISTIAHLNVHDAIRKYGFWNWSIEVITYCEKEQLSELEKHYIDFFQTNSFGYNRTNGGEG